MLNLPQWKMKSAFYPHNKSSHFKMRADKPLLKHCAMLFTFFCCTHHCYLDQIFPVPLPFSHLGANIMCLIFKIWFFPPLLEKWILYLEEKEKKPAADLQLHGSNLFYNPELVSKRKIKNQKKPPTPQKPTHPAFTSWKTIFKLWTKQICHQTHLVRIYISCGRILRLANWNINLGLNWYGNESGLRHANASFHLLLQAEGTCPFWNSGDNHSASQPRLSTASPVPPSERKSNQLCLPRALAAEGQWSTQAARGIFGHSAFRVMGCLMQQVSWLLLDIWDTCGLLDTNISVALFLRHIRVSFLY